MVDFKDFHFMKHFWVEEVISNAIRAGSMLWQLVKGLEIKRKMSASKYQIID